MTSPIHNPEAERCVIGAMLLNGRVAGRIAATLPAEAFYIPAHRAIFSAACRLVSEGKEPDLLLLKNKLMEAEALEESGGVEYLIQIAEGVPSASNGEHYAAVVREHWALRQLQAAGEAIPAIVADPDKSLGEKRDAAIAAVEAVQAPQPGESAFRSVALVNLPGVVEGVTSGIPRIDKATGAGFPLGQLSIVSAYHKGGKTILGTQACRAAATVGANEGWGVVYATFADLNPEGLKARMFRQCSGRNWPQDTYDQEILTALEGLPIEFYDGRKSGRSIRDFARNMAWRLESAKPWPIKAVIVDYAQKVWAPGNIFERNQAVSEGLDNLAQDYGIAVVALSQISGQVKGDTTSDIATKGGRSLEEDAGLVIRLLSTEEEGIDERGNPVTKISRSIDIPYNRFGPADTFAAVIDKQKLTFSEKGE